ncbi:MAG: ASKHA domain-containing protein [Thermodesulfobacteriota bacterium]
MEEIKIVFNPDKIEVLVPQGENLLRAAMRAGIHINASCGGEGVCGKCRVIIDKGEVESERTEKLTPEDYALGVRQACKTKVIGDLEVTIPTESQLDRKVLDRVQPRSGAWQVVSQIKMEELIVDGKFFPPFEKKYLEISPPTLSDNISDLSRVIRSLKQTYGIHGLIVDFYPIKKLAEVLRQGEWKVTVTIGNPLKIGDKIQLINIEPGDTTQQNYAIAIDIGTTTVWGQLLDLNSGSILAQHVEYNSQISYGEDVISRIVYTQKPGGRQKMKDLVISTINGIIKQLLKKYKVSSESITHMTLAGNTTMTHLFLGIESRYIREAPYTPPMNYIPPVVAKEIGLQVEEHVQAFLFPSIASYVGGDVIAGVMGSGMSRQNKLTLYIDLGTNGEIVIGNSEWMTCAACSAGPAFEGGGIKHGMRATEGAIEDFSVNPKTFDPMLLTIGMVKPKGICGSGLINIVAGLLEGCLLDQNGKFKHGLKTDRIREGSDGLEYVLAWADDTQIKRDIVITEVDIDNLIRAKGAMYAGYITLLSEVGLSMNDLEQVIIAGGFGNYINIEKSITIGLLPELPLEKFKFIGNGSLLGARLICFSNVLRSEIKNIFNKITNIELSENHNFMNNYIAALFLPHTDNNLFPGVFDLISCVEKWADYTTKDDRK